MLEALRRDLRHYRDAGALSHVGFWTGTAYRLTSFCHALPVGSGVLTAAARAAVSPLAFVRGVSIPPGTRIGPGLCLHHPQNVVISEHAVIGEDCTLYQDVVVAEGGTVPGAPTIGDRVTVFAGAKVLGGVTIGDDVEIGANAVVTRDVPSDSVVASAPGRPIPRATIEKMRRER